MNISGNEDLDTVVLKVRRGLGTIVGNFMRQLMCRETTWQIIGYNVQSEKETALKGMSLNQLDVIRGKLTVLQDVPNKMPLIATLKKDGNLYKDTVFQISGLGNLPYDTLKVALTYSHGIRSTDENYELVKSLIGTEVNKYIIIASSHGNSNKFLFKVTSETLDCDTITISAQKDALRKALELYYETANQLSEAVG